MMRAWRFLRLFRDGDLSQVDTLDPRYESVNFGAKKSPGSALGCTVERPGFAPHDESVFFLAVGEEGWFFRSELVRVDRVFIHPAFSVWGLGFRV